MALVRLGGRGPFLGFACFDPFLDSVTRDSRISRFSWALSAPEKRPQPMLSAARAPSFNVVLNFLNMVSMLFRGTSAFLTAFLTLFLVALCLPNLMKMLRIILNAIKSSPAASRITFLSPVSPSYSRRAARPRVKSVITSPVVQVDQCLDKYPSSFLVFFFGDRDVEEAELLLEVDPSDEESLDLKSSLNSLRWLFANGD